ncbi:MAG: hypothetical protein H6837_02820 [Planctomycetes bacterium]|nr:hypothetical protein [Planctomycetota bacterium]
MLNHSHRAAVSFLSIGVVFLASTVAAQTAEPAPKRDHEDRIQALEAALRQSDAPARDRQWFVGYEKGYVIRSLDMDKVPFSLRINGRMQFRYSGFEAEDKTFQNLGTMASGTPIRSRARSDFEIERGRLEFNGTFKDKNLHFYINLDADTDDNHSVIFHDFWVNYDLNEKHSIYLGKAFVPASREWLNGSTTSHFADRSMATTFFRPDRSVGIWAIGEVAPDVHYRVMVGNGYNTTDLNVAQVNRDFAFSGSVWVEPTGKFGRGYADLKAESNLRTRFGASAAYAEESGVTSSNVALAETNFLRLDDGTRLTQLGVNHFSMWIAAVDVSLKVAGFSLHGEGYYRWLDSIRPIGAAPAGFPFRRNEAYGGYVMAGQMLVPERLELVLLTSTVQGDFKRTWEYGVAVNWYVDGTHTNKVTLDAIHLNGSPASNSGPNYSVGDDGMMFRVQHQLGW